jgi:hypothetical protein
LNIKDLKNEYRIATGYKLNELFDFTFKELIDCIKREDHLFEMDKYENIRALP